MLLNKQTLLNYIFYTVTELGILRMEIAPYMIIGHNSEFKSEEKSYFLFL
jgi:hypothetical protein